MPPSSDVLIAGRYRLGDKIADGGMSTVWEAWDERLHRRVALKQLRLQSGLSDADARLAADRAMREARITARLHHPNAVPVYDVVDDNGSPCLVMQYLPSRTLQALLAEHSTLDPAQVARIGAEIAAALAAAHDAGIVHRDVKPGNVLIDESGAAKLTDFGISHALGDVTLTSTGMVTGTPAYLAPEAARGEPAGFPADVFALGATLATALEGTPPVGNSDNPIAVLHRVASGQVNRPEQTSPLTTLLHHMLALDPAARPAMADVAAELERIARQSAAPGVAATTERLAAVPGAGTNDGPPPSTTVILPPARDDRPASAVAPPPQNRAPVGPPPLNRPPVRPAPSRRRPGRGPLAALAIVVALLLVLGFVLLGVYLTSSGSGTPASTGSTTHQSSPRQSPSARRSTTHSAGSTPATSTSNSPTTSSRPPSSSSSSSASSSSSGSGTSPGAAVSAVENYYALLPGDTNDAWQRLTANYQQNHAGGRSGYDAFWSGYRSVRTSNVHSLGGSRVEADLTYTKKNGSVIHEVDDYTLVDQGGTLKIDQSDVVSG